MRASNAAKLVLGATLLVAGFGVLTDGSPTRGPVIQAVTGLFDMEERECRHAQVAIGSSCPAGCAAKPVASAEGRLAPPECHSKIWLATCGKSCAPEDGFARPSGAGLVDSDRLIVTLHAEPDDAFRNRLAAMGVTLVSRFDGLDRYDAAVAGGDIVKIKKRLSALPEVVSADFVPR